MLLEDENNRKVFFFSFIFLFDYCINLKTNDVIPNLKRQISSLNNENEHLRNDFEKCRYEIEVI
jgi:hypothetical protein